MNMTLEQAIERAEDTAKSAIGYECREEHRQLAEWLRELQSYKTRDARFRPRKLYALEHISTGKIIFNARGGAYKLREEAEDKLKRLGGKGYRIIVYELRAEGAE